MKVKVNNRIYRMNREEYQGLLKIEREDYAELRCDHCDSITKLKKLTRQFKSQGFKVLSNGKDK